jgi:methyl-accepting chemotaxis protein
LAAAKLFLESLGPNNELHNSIAELQLLLNAETAIILSQVNRRTSDMYKELREASATTKEISERTIEIRDNLTKEKQKGTETSVAIEQLSIAMDRVEAASGASHASLEEVKELILSAWQG